MKKLLLSGALLFSLFQAAGASVSVGKNLFEKGRTRLHISGGAGQAFSDDYMVLGLGAGYFIANGLEVGLDGEAWWGNNPNIYTLSPKVNYVFYKLERLNPYIGTFYKRTFYESYTDLDSYGGRVGAFVPLSRNVSFGFGYVFETFVDCDDRIYSSCSSEYPEVSISAGF